MLALLGLSASGASDEQKITPFVWKNARRTLNLNAERASEKAERGEPGTHNTLAGYMEAKAAIELGDETCDICTPAENTVLNCCSKGASWEGTCEQGMRHTWLAGYSACNGDTDAKVGTISARAVIQDKMKEANMTRDDLAPKYRKILDDVPAHERPQDQLETHDVDPKQPRKDASKADAQPKRAGEAADWARAHPKLAMAGAKGEKAAASTQQKSHAASQLADPLNAHPSKDADWAKAHPKRADEAADWAKAHPRLAHAQGQPTLGSPATKAATPAKSARSAAEEKRALVPKTDSDSAKGPAANSADWAKAHPRRAADAQLTTADKELHEATEELAVSKIEQESSAEAMSSARGVGMRVSLTRGSGAVDTPDVLSSTAFEEEMAAAHQEVQKIAQSLDSLHAKLANDGAAAAGSP